MKMNEEKEYCLGDYKALITTFINKGYSFVSFDDFVLPEGQVALRHDIDYDVKLAWMTAKAEKELGVISTFFFLLRSPFYNPFGEMEFKMIKEIKEMGHTISIHFDPVLYEDFHQGFENEVVLFEMMFNTKVKIISLHRPNDFFQNYDLPIGQVNHTYQSKFFKEKKYISDSTGIWRFGIPYDTAEFAAFKSIQLLIHPIWWFVPGKTNYDVLKNYFHSRIDALKSDFLKNSIPFKDIVNEL